MSDFIMLDYHQDKKIEAVQGSTYFSDLSLILSLEATSKLNEAAGYRNYATDNAGLETTIDKANELIISLNNTVGAISRLITFSDMKEVHPEINTCMWHLTGLSELSTQVQVAIQNMQYSLDHQRSIEANKKAPAN